MYELIYSCEIIPYCVYQLALWLAQARQRICTDYTHACRNTPAVKHTRIYVRTYTFVITRLCIRGREISRVQIPTQMHYTPLRKPKPVTSV